MFALGIVTRWRRWTGWSYVLTCAGLFSYWLDYSTDDHRLPIHLLGIGCLAAQQQFRRRYDRTDLAATWCPPSVQGALIVAAVLAAWSAWSAAVVHWNGSGILLAASWSLFAAAVFVVGLLLHERVYRWMALLLLVTTLAHVLLIDIWQLDSSGAVPQFAQSGRRAAWPLAFFTPGTSQNSVICFEMVTCYE